MARVLVCGGRNFNDRALLIMTLDDLHRDRHITAIIEGDARGADRLAGYWARRNKIDNVKFPAQWDKYGKSAGFKRNAEMLRDGRPDIVVAFPGGRGTDMMVDLAEQRAVEVIKIG